jgi:hypothetical protein
MTRSSRARLLAQNIITLVSLILSGVSSRDKRQVFDSMHAHYCRPGSARGA